MHLPFAFFLINIRDKRFEVLYSSRTFKDKQFMQTTLKGTTVNLACRSIIGHLSKWRAQSKITGPGPSTRSKTDWISTGGEGNDMKITQDPGKQVLFHVLYRNHAKKTEVWPTVAYLFTIALPEIFHIYRQICIHKFAWCLFAVWFSLPFSACVFLGECVRFFGGASLP